MAVLEVRLIEGAAALLALGFSVQVFDLVAVELLDFIDRNFHVSRQILPVLPVLVAPKVVLALVPSLTVVAGVPLVSSPLRAWPLWVLGLRPSC